MKRTFQKFVARLAGVKIHADHTAIKGQKSSGSKDNSSSMGDHWKVDTDYN